MEVNEILKYKRKKDVWLCPECDTENDITFENCIVCNCKKTAGVSVLKAWNIVEEHFKTTTEVKGDVGDATERVSKDTDFVLQEKEEDESVGDKIGRVALWILGGLVLISLIIIASEGV